MRSLKNLFIAFLTLLIINPLHAQVFLDYLKSADSYYRNGDYNSATIYYKKYLDIGAKKGAGNYEPYQVKQVKAQKEGRKKITTREEAVYRLADSYRKLHNFPEALPWYREAAQWRDQFPDAPYWYAVSLRTTGDFENAEKAFEDFLSGSIADADMKTKAEKELANLKFINAQLKKPGVERYSVTKAPVINATSQSAPAMVNNLLYFSASVPDTAKGAKKNAYVNQIYQAFYKDGQAADIASLDFNDEPGMHHSAASLTPDGNTMYLTRWNGSGDSKRANIYRSTKSANGWSQPEAVTGINVDGYSSQEPFITPDGKFLLFSSNRPGGEGKFDIYYVALSNGKISGTITNMGKQFNTPEDERAPYYHERTRTFIYSTNGKVGMGGMDFFKANGEITSLSTPVNMGYPYNSIKDDMYFLAYGRNLFNNVLLSSDRGSACCLDLYTLERSKIDKYVTGRIISCKESKALDSTTLVVRDQSGKVVDTLTTDANGYYSLTIPDFKTLSFSLKRKGYIPGGGSVNAPNEDLDIDSITAADICIEPVPIPEDEPIVLTNIYFEFAKADIRPNSFDFLDSLAAFMNKYPTMVIEISGHTDDVGSDEKNQLLSEQRAASVVAYLEGKGVAADRMQSVGFGETKPVAPNKKPNGKDNPEGREKNRRIEFRVLHY